MRGLLIASSPSLLAAVAPLPARLVVDPGRTGTLGADEAVAIDCGGRHRGRIEPAAVARRILTAYDLRRLGEIRVAPDLMAAIAPCLPPGGPRPLPVTSPQAPTARCAPPVLLATLELPPAGWSVHRERADRARGQRETLGDAAAATLRAGHPTALVVDPAADGSDRHRAAERAARALAIAALRAAGKGRAPLVLHGDAVLRALVAATRSGGYLLESRHAGLVHARLGGRRVLIATGAPPVVSEEDAGGSRP